MSAHTPLAPAFRGNFLGTGWQPVAAADGPLLRHNPCRPEELVFEGAWCLAHVDQAVCDARRALAGWDRLGVEGRLPYLRRLEAIFKRRAEELARAIALETGKPLWEARTEATALSAKVDIMTGEGLQYTREVHPEGLAGGLFRYRPLGVLAVLGPFNFPLHLPNGHIIPALATGNTVVFKPSEVTPGCAQLYMECVEEAGFPEGVVTMVHGPGQLGAALVAHPQVSGVLFTGAYETGLRIKEATLRQPWKLLALEMGGKNTSLVLDDANLEQAIDEILMAACMTTGQRCSATSRVVVHRALADALLEGLAEAMGRVTSGDAFLEQAFMGPLVTEGALAKFLAAQANDEGGHLRPILKGGRDREDLGGHFVRPGLWLAQEADPCGTHQGCEIFGPDVTVYIAESDLQAAELANATAFGLAMSVFTADEERFERLSYALHAGVLNLNRSTVGASSRLPFGGVKSSGNHRPSAVLAGQYCTYPQAQLRQKAGWQAGAHNQPPLSLLRPRS